MLLISRRTIARKVWGPCAGGSGVIERSGRKLWTFRRRNRGNVAARSSHAAGPCSVARAASASARLADGPWAGLASHIYRGPFADRIHYGENRMLWARCRTLWIMESLSRRAAKARTEAWPGAGRADCRSLNWARPRCVDLLA